MSSGPSIGEMAPDINLPTDQDGVFSLADHKGRAIVVYFYPKDDTPGCTKQAIGFTEQAAAFADAGALVVGISADTVEKHARFRSKHDLGVVLASDENHDVLERYGVWVEKNMYGRKYMGIERATYLIAPDGRIAQIWRKVKVPGHVDKVLEAARELGA